MQTIQSGGDGVKKFCALIVAAAVMLCLYYTVRTYGNIFYMSYALNSAKKICNREYGSSLSVSNYRYERENDRYLITVTDVNGLSADVVYDSVNGIRDGYADVYKSVRANTVRGEFQRILNSLGIDAVCNVKMKKSKRSAGTVGGAEHCILISVYAEIKMIFPRKSFRLFRHFVKLILIYFMPHVFLTAKIMFFILQNRIYLKTPMISASGSTN